MIKRIKIRSQLIIYLFFLLSYSLAQQNFTAPGLEYICELKIKLDPAIVVGQTPKGLRRIIPITGGTVNGPQIKAEILPGGADWQYIRPDGTVELEAHYQIKTSDSVIIYIVNTGIRVATPEITAKMAKGEFVPANEYYFRATPKFESPAGKYYWMNNSLFIAKGIRNPDFVSIQVWKVL
ncbi:MAG: DUF3237 domain-containing protein [Saprospiraceae bacterium]